MHVVSFPIYISRSLFEQITLSLFLHGFTRFSSSSSSIHGRRLTFLARSKPLFVLSSAQGIAESRKEKENPIFSLSFAWFLSSFLFFFIFSFTLSLCLIGVSGFFLRWCEQRKRRHTADQEEQRLSLYVSGLQRDLLRWNRRALKSLAMAPAAKKTTSPRTSLPPSSCCRADSVPVPRRASSSPGAVVSANAVQDWSVPSTDRRDDLRSKKIAAATSLIPEPSANTSSTKGLFSHFSLCFWMSCCLFTACFCEI